MFDKFLQELGIDKVSQKTKISRKYLSKLRNKDFDGFSKPQAYGFVKILEREYGEKFEDLRAELDAWFCEGEECQKEIFVVQKNSTQKSKIKNIVIIALSIFLAIVAIFLYLYLQSNKQDDSNEKILPPSVQKESLNSLSINQESLGNSQKIEAMAEKNSTIVNDLNAVKYKASENSQSGNVLEDSYIENNEPYVPRENPTVVPHVKLWIGLIDLETKKRVAKTTIEPFEIEFVGKKLLVTGHGRFEFSDSFGNLLKFNDAKKHYFLIEDGVVKELSKEEFERLNGGRVW